MIGVSVGQFVMYWRQWCIMKDTLKHTVTISRLNMRQARRADLGQSSERGT
jgi:hypothetical protein